MKKQTLKIIYALTVAAVAVAAVNQRIFLNAERPLPDKPEEAVYQWRFGKIRYTACGEGKPLLLIHGAGQGGGLHEWRNNINALARRYRVYALDLIGFGGSDKPAVSYSPYLFISLINDFIRAVIGQKTNVVASAHGAAFAVGAYHFEPDNFDRLLLVSPAGVTSQSPQTGASKWLQLFLDSPLIGTSFFNLMHSKTVLKQYLSIDGYANAGAVSDAVINDYYIAAHSGGANARYASSAYLSHFLDMDLERLFEKLPPETPIHIVWGTENKRNPVANLDCIRAVRPNVATTLFENTKERPFAEQPKAFHQLCQTFFR